MDKDFLRAAENNLNAIASQIEDSIGGCHVNNLGSCVMVMCDNGSIATVYSITSQTVDIYCKDLVDKNYEFKDLSISDALTFLGQIASLTVNEDTSRLDFPFGESPLGASERNPDEKSKSEGKRKSAISHNYENGSPLALSESSGSQDDSQVSGSNSISEDVDSGFRNQTLDYLAEMLPSDSAEVVGNILTVSIDCAKIIITAQDDGNFSVESFVNDELVQASENLSASDLVKWSFQICGNIQSRAAARDSENNVEISQDDIWGTLHELATESGMSDNILRNKNLYELKKLCLTKSPKTIQPNESVPTIAAASSIRGSRTHNGAPVSLNESRDASKPYADTLGGKKLVFLPGVGATLVDEKDLPKRNKLNFHPLYGVVLTESSEPTNRKGMWKFSGYR